MKMNWEEKRLGEVIKLEYGKPLPNDKRKSDGLYPVYGANGEISRSDEYYFDKYSIIVGRKGSAGEVKLSDNHFWPLDVTYFVTYDESRYDLVFLYYLLIFLDLPKLAKGVKPGINRNDVYEISVYIPPLPEQQRIVALLDQAFAAIDTAQKNTEKNLQNTQLLFEGYLNKVLSNPGQDWEKCKMVEVLLKTETINPTKNPDDYFDYIDVSSVNNQNYNIEITTKIKGIDAPSRARKLVNFGDVIFATVRPTLKRIAIIPEHLDGKICSTGYVVLKVTEKVINKYLFYFLLSNKFMNKMEQLQKGASYPAVTETDVKNQFLFYPKSPQEQKIIINKLDTLSNATNKLKAKYLRKLKVLEELKKSILQKAFVGDL